MIKLIAKLDAMTLRERALVLMATLGVYYGIGAFVALPLFDADAQTIAQSISTENTKQQALTAELAGVKASGNWDPDTASRTQIAALEAELNKADPEVAQWRDGLVSPVDMAPLVHQILGTKVGLEMTLVEHLPPIAMQDKKQKAVDKEGKEAKAEDKNVTKEADAEVAPTSETHPLFRHGVMIQVEGRYAELVDFLIALENLPRRVLWGEVQLQVDEYPRSMMTVKIYTLGADEKWLAI